MNKIYLEIPKVCPICGGKTEIRQINDSKELVCTNPECQGKLINKLDHFCSKKGLDIKGLSKATLEKLIDWGWVSTFEDIFNLNSYAYEWTEKDGFGPKSVENILKSIETAKNTTLPAFISALGIPLIGQNVSKDLTKKVKTYTALRKMVDEGFDFSQFDGFAEAKTAALLDFDYSEADKLVTYLNIAPVEEEIKIEGGNASSVANKTFVVTGRLNNFKNRDELKDLIEKNGGKVVKTISSNTDYLINNDLNSTSVKNKTAKERGIPIISEDTLMQMI